MVEAVALLFPDRQKTKIFLSLGSSIDRRVNSCKGIATLPFTVPAATSPGVLTSKNITSEFSLKRTASSQEMSFTTKGVGFVFGRTLVASFLFSGLDSPHPNANKTNKNKKINFCFIIIARSEEHTSELQSRP